MKRRLNIVILLKSIIPTIVISAIFLIATFSFTLERYSLSETQNSIKKYNETNSKNMKRFGKIIKVNPDKLNYYKKLHANPWPEVLEAIHECNIRNFSIYYRDGYLFSYFEYIGEDHDADMKKLEELTKHWLKETDPCQIPVESAKKGEWWSNMEEVFHTD